MKRTALILAAARRLPQQVAELKRGIWQTGVGDTLRGRLTVLESRVMNSKPDLGLAR